MASPRELVEQCRDAIPGRAKVVVCVLRCQGIKCPYTGAGARAIVHAGTLEQGGPRPRGRLALERDGPHSRVGVEPSSEANPARGGIKASSEADLTRGSV
jgi:hypothetical protein